MSRQIRRLRKGRCVAILTLLILAVSFLCGAFSPQAGASIADGRELQSVCIQPGDTLWQLVDEYYAYSGDIRAALYEVRQINSMSSPELTPGQVVYIPYN